MNVPQKTLNTMTRAVLVIALALFASFGSVPVAGQGGGAPQGGGGGFQGGGQGGRGQGQGGRGGQAQPSNLPSAPTAVTLPTLSAEVTGPGPMFDSATSLPPGKGLAAFKYEAHEYFVSGTANGQPYTTRIVVRRPANPSAFSGLVLAESMHSSGAAHMFEFTSIYTMSSGHIAVDMLTSSPQPFVQMNEARYKDLRIAGGQTNEIIAQIGALVRTGKPLGGLTVRKMVLSGTSMSAGVLLNYLPAHMVYRTPEMQRIFDGFMPTSNGSLAQDIDVPLIQLPTMHEVVGNITTRQDSDEPGKQYRLYEFSGIAHVDTRDSVRFKPNPCAQPISEFPNQAYMSVGLHHLFQWVDKGIVAPRAERVWLDQDEHNDGSRLVLDEHGNPRGGIRNTYVDVPTAKYVIRPPAITPLIANPSAWIVANGGQTGANLMCGLAGAQLPFSQAKLKELYKSKKSYVSMVEKRLTELEKTGWSLPVYRELILADANKIMF
ncbi:MAG TPA: alpha/beta hydrolase domain-containing protein [Vicinamibacterales bacterium]|nr:alpha/beta hydrolase domain-containing protein [Vicinamibacterales bacterium]